MDRPTKHENNNKISKLSNKLMLFLPSWKYEKKKRDRECFDNRI